MHESQRILQENTRNRWPIEAVFRPEILQISSGGLMPASGAFRPKYCFQKITGIARNRPFPDRAVRPG